MGQPITLKQIKDFSNSFSKDKSFGPDGWTLEFYLAFFELVGGDILSMVEEARVIGKGSRDINFTFLAMIPKSSKPQSFNDYRPISLCNIIYKVIEGFVLQTERCFFYKSLCGTIWVPLRSSDSWCHWLGPRGYSLYQNLEIMCSHPQDGSCRGI